MFKSPFLDGAICCNMLPHDVKSSQDIYVSISIKHMKLKSMMQVYILYGIVNCATLFYTKRIVTLCKYFKY